MELTTSQWDSVFSSGTPMEVDESPRQRHTPKRGQGNTTLRKVQSNNTPVRLPKRRHDSDEEEKGTPLKVRKIEDKSTPGTPRFTVMKQKFEDQGGYQLVSVRTIHSCNAEFFSYTTLLPNFYRVNLRHSSWKHVYVHSWW